MIKLKLFKEASIKGAELLDYIQKENPKAICEKFEMESKEKYLQYLFSTESNLIVSYKCDSAIWSLKNNVAVSLYFLRDYEKALSYIEEDEL